VWHAPEARAQADVPAIKVESFNEDVGSDGSTFSLTNDVGDTSSAFVRMNTGTRKTSGGPLGNTGNTSPNVGTVGLVLSSTNQVTVERVDPTPVKVIGEVWRYEGIAGGGNEFITRDRVQVALVGTSVTVPVSGVTNSDRVVPFVTGYTANGTSVNDWNDATIAAHMTDAGELQVSRNNTGIAATVYVDIVEFTGSNWVVCHAFSDAHDTAEQTLTLNTSADGAGGAACDVEDWSTATIIQATMEGDSTETGLSDTLALVRPGATTQTVVFDVQQDVNGRNDGRAWIQVLQNDDLTVDRGSNANLGEGNNTFGTIPFPAGVDGTTPTDELALEWFADTSGVGTAHMRGGLHAGIFASSTSISHWIHRSGNSVGVEYGVIDLSNLEAITGSTFATALGNQITTTTAGLADVFFGNTFAVTELATAQNITNIVLTESGTVDASLGLSNVRLRYELDTTSPYDCVDETYDGSESQYGAVATFSAADGTAVFNDSVSITPTTAFCGYVVADVTGDAQDAQTINFSIADTETDITVTGSGVTVSGGELGSGSDTTIVNSELTQTGYHWRNDDGSETMATSVTGGVENTPGLAFAVGTPQRLRLGVAALGSGTDTYSYQLEYAQKISTCSAVSAWTTVDGAGGAWDMFDSTFTFEGDDTTNIAVANGGVSDVGLTFVTLNGGVRDVTDQTGAITLDANVSEFVELEYAIEPTASAVEGVSYCFRVRSDAGGDNVLRYDNYAEATLSGDVSVSSEGSQVASVTNGQADAAIGGTFVVSNTTGSRTVNEVTIAQVGTADSVTDINAVRLRYDLDTAFPYDCSSQSYDGGEPQFGIDGLFGAGGTSTFIGSVSITPTQSLCLYPEIDVAATALDAATIELAILNPSQDVVTDSGSVGPGSQIDIAGTTVIQASALTQAGYHWRNDDGDEAGATSASGGVENAGIGPIFQGSTQRLRVAVVNDGSLTQAAAQLRLEYGTKVTSCENVGVWQRVDSGVAFDIDTGSQLIDGADTTNIAVGDGGITDPAGTFITPNAGQESTVDQLATLAVATTEFVEVEFAVEITEQSAFGTTYCFRLSDDGQSFTSYDNYAELTIQEQQDFFVQHGTERVTGTSQTLTAGVDYDAPASNSSAFVRITNTVMTGASSDSFGAQRNADDFFAYIAGPVDLTSSFTIERPPTATQDTRVSWEIVEYIGVAGGDNEFVVRDADAVSYGGASLTAAGAAVPGVVDDTDVAVFITGQLNPSTGSNDFNVALSISSWDAGSDQPLFERGDADNLAAGVSYAVVEFTGSNWNVQRVAHTYTAAGVTETSPITAVNSLSRTFLHAQKTAGDELYNLDEGGHTVWLSSIGAVSFELQAGATSPAEHESVAWVIENTQQGAGSMQVYRTSGVVANGGAEPATFNLNIGGTVNVTSASIWATSRSTGAGNFHPRVILGASIISETQYEFWRSDNGQSQAYRVEVIDWPVAETTITQTTYRLYVDNDTLTPTDPWPAGASDLGENTAMTDLDEPIGLGEQVRLRTGLQVNNASLVTGSANFTLQYGRRVTTCSAVGDWVDVGDPRSGAIWRGYDAAPVSGTTLPSALLSVTDQLGTYEEDSPSAANPVTVEVGEYIEYDWNIEHNGALQKSSYCFRMINDDGSEIDGYETYPTVRTTGYTPVITNWRWYDDAENLTPTNPLSAELTAPIGLIASNTVKLRVAVTEIEGAPGEDIKFNLQYSQWADFRDGGTTLTATTACSASIGTWCYADGAGVDNQIIDTTVLSTVDVCTAGVGDGCGTYNEAIGLAGTYDQSVFTTSEHEFTLLHNDIGFDQVYYFRMVDATNGVSLLASSSYPSIATAGAALTFNISGIDAGLAFEGVTLDATTTSVGVSFGALPFNTDVEAAQRLTVYTNGTQGYRIFLVADQQLINSNGDELSPVTGTNAAPLAWSTGCVGGVSSCFGYHAGDDTLYNGSVRFALDDSYAALDTSPQEIMSSNVPVTFDTSEIIYRTQISELQPAGEYSTTLQYIAVPVF